MKKIICAAFLGLCFNLYGQNYNIIQQNQQNVTINNLPVIEKTVYVDRYRYVYVKRTPKKLHDVPCLHGYLYVYPEDLGNFRNQAEALEIINNINRVQSWGRDDWRIPTPAELRVLEQNADDLGLGDEIYLCTSHANGVLRLVSTGKSVQEKEREAAKRADEEWARQREAAAKAEAQQRAREEAAREAAAKAEAQQRAREEAAREAAAKAEAQQRAREAAAEAEAQQRAREAIRMSRIEEEIFIAHYPLEALKKYTGCEFQLYEVDLRRGGLRNSQPNKVGDSYKYSISLDYVPYGWTLISTSLLESMLRYPSCQSYLTGDEILNNIELALKDYHIVFSDAYFEYNKKYSWVGLRPELGTLINYRVIKISTKGIPKSSSEIVSNSGLYKLHLLLYK